MAGQNVLTPVTSYLGVTESFTEGEGNGLGVENKINALATAGEGASFDKIDVYQALWKKMSSNCPSFGLHDLVRVYTHTRNIAQEIFDTERNFFVLCRWFGACC